MYPKWLILIAAASFWPALHGCGGSNAVSGSVTFDGQPVANGSIAFLPEDGLGPVAGDKISAGRYRVENIMPGRKIVQIIGVKKVNFAASQEEMAQAAKAHAQTGDASGIVERADTIPPNAEGNNRVVDVQSGQTELNFSLMPTPAHPVAPAAVKK
jgi:hypothetical protein